MCSEMIQLFSERDDSVAIKFVVLSLTEVYEQQQLVGSSWNDLLDTTTVQVHNLVGSY